MYGGTITGISVPSHDNAANAGSDDYATIVVTYSVAATPGKVQLLWGGHLAASGGPRGWGAGLGAGNINGGPYHFKWAGVDGSSIGSRDNQIMADAIQVPASPTPTATNTATTVPSSTATRTPTVTPSPTPACPSTPLGVAAPFNMFMLGNVNQSGSDTEGRMAIGGTATLANYDIGLKLTNSNGTRDDLIVGANVSYNSGQVNNGNAVYVGTGSFTSVNFLHGSYRQGSVMDFTAAGNYLRNASTYWSTLAATGTSTFQYGGYTLTGNNAGLNVFTVSGSNLANANQFIINAPAGSTVLINIDGTADRMQNFGFTLNGVNRQGVLFNFYQATTLTLSGIGVEGSVLAPLAAFTFTSGNINGQIIGASLSGQGQTNYYLFTGCLPAPPASPTNTATRTATNTPSNTPTNTPVPPTNTATRTATNTPSNTPSNTPVPPTNTATRTADQHAEQTPSNTPVPPTNTATRHPDQHPGAADQHRDRDADQYPGATDQHGHAHPDPHPHPDGDEHAHPAGNLSGRDADPYRHPGLDADG